MSDGLWQSGNNLLSTGVVASREHFIVAQSPCQIPRERVISNLAEYGNTSAASIPLALDEAVRAGSVKAGDTVR